MILIDEEQKFRGGLACIDVLSKYAVVIPIVSKNEPHVVEATKKALEKKGARNQRLSVQTTKAQ